MKAPRGQSALQREVFNTLGGSLQRSYNVPLVGSEAIEESRERRSDGQAEASLETTAPLLA